jgi:N-acetylglutamate synthase-like GNAT family acetyltransferase
MKFIYPKFETENRGFVNAIVKIDNPFLQGLVDIGGTLFLEREFTLMGWDTLVMFKVVDDKTIVLECISTPYDKRNQGSATKVLNAIMAIAKDTETTINLFACNVTGNGFNMMQQMVIAVGMVKTNKIPVSKLKGWYEKFGFKLVKHDKVRKGWEMTYNPLN